MPASETFRAYFTGISEAKTSFINALQSGDEEYIGSIYLETDPEAVEEDQIEDGLTSEEELDAASSELIKGAEEDA